MIFDVMIREGHNANGKPIMKVFRVHDAKLSTMLRDLQDGGKYIHSVIPLFRQKREEVTDKDKEYAIANGVVERSFLIKKGSLESVYKDNFDGL